MKTHSAKLNRRGEVVIGDQVHPRKWVEVDATGLPVGRVASAVASVLKGKTKPYYTPHVDVGDFVVVINADKIAFSGSKDTQKFYYHYTGYPGGMRSVRADKQLEAHPERVVKAAIRGMLPKNPLGRRMLRKLKVYTGPEHPHAAQQPTKLTL